MLAGQCEKQLVAVLVLGLFSFGMTALIGTVVDLTVGLRQPHGTEEHEQVYQNDWDVQFKEIADALRGSGLDEGTAEPDASALLDRVRRILTSDQEHLPD